jgi:hypothetical protein
MRRLTIILTIIAAMAMIVSPAGANGRWDTQVTGSVTFDASGYSDIELDVSSRVDADGNAKGQMQYSRSDLSFHIDVDCVYQGPNGYAFSGPTKVQAGDIGPYASVEVKHDGSAVRVREVSSSVTCGYSGSYGATVKTGSFNVKQ